MQVDKEVTLDPALTLILDTSRAGVDFTALRSTTALTNMAAPTNTNTESFVENVWGLWTEPNPAAPTSAATTKALLRNWWKNTTPARRSSYIRLIADLNEASDHAGQAKQALQLEPSWARLDAARRKITALVTDDEKELMTDYVVRCKSAIRYYRMYRARLDNFWTQLDTNGLGSQTRARVDQITMQDQALITTWVIRKDILTTALANYNFVSMRSLPRFITADILQQNKVSLECAYDEDGRIADVSCVSNYGTRCANSWTLEGYKEGRKIYPERVGHNLALEARRSIDRHTKRILLRREMPCHRGL